MKTSRTALQKPQVASSGVYFDYAATTPVDARVRDAMRPYECDIFANPRSLHAAGKEARAAYAGARGRIAELLGAASDEIRFLGSATAANAYAMHGVLNAHLDAGGALSDMHIIISAIEHASVRACAELLSRRGVSVSYIPVTREGIVDVAAFEKLLSPKTVFVSVMLVNNEVGTIQPIQELGRMIEKANENRRRPIAFHTDGSEAPLWLSVSPKKLRVHLLTLDGHKMYGPKGVSVLYVAHGTPYAGLCGTPHSDPGDDGSEGTPAVGSVVGFAEALALCEESRAGDVARIRALREYFFKRLTERFPDVRIHGSTTERVANNVNVSFPNIEGEFLVSQLSHNGVYASAKSACLSGGTEGSYVIAALDPERTNNAVRFSLGRETTQDDIDLCISVLVDLVA